MNGISQNYLFHIESDKAPKKYKYIQSIYKLLQSDIMNDKRKAIKKAARLLVENIMNDNLIEANETLSKLIMVEEFSSENKTFQIHLTMRPMETRSTMGRL